MRAGHGLILLTIALLCVGVVMVNSAGLSVGSDTSISRDGVLFSRPAMLALLAIVALLIGSFTPIELQFRARGVQSPVPWILLASIALLLIVHVPGFGKEVNGARRWLNLGPLSFQASEIAKWGLLIVLAWHGARRAGGMGRFFTGFVAPMCIVGLLCALIAVEDLGTAVLVGLVCVCVLLAAGAKLWHAALLLPIGAAGFIGALVAAPYRMRRLQAFADPYQGPAGHRLSHAAIHGGGFERRHRRARSGKWRA